MYETNEDDEIYVVDFPSFEKVFDDIPKEIREKLIYFYDIFDRP